MMKYQAKVKWNTNHYDSGEVVKGSEIRTLDNGTIELFDDEPYYVTIDNQLVDFTRYEWVEIDPETLVTPNE